MGLLVGSSWSPAYSALPLSKGSPVGPLRRFKLSVLYNTIPSRHSSFQTVLLSFTSNMKLSRSWRKYIVLDQDTGLYWCTDWTLKKVVADHERNPATFANYWEIEVTGVEAVDSHKVPRLRGIFKRVTVTLRKPLDCAACGKPSDCAEIPGPGVRHSEVWICKRCWKTEMQQRRNANIRRGLLRGNPDRLVTHSWPKRRRIRKVAKRTRPNGSPS